MISLRTYSISWETHSHFSSPDSSPLDGQLMLSGILWTSTTACNISLKAQITHVIWNCMGHTSQSIPRFRCGSQVNIMLHFFNLLFRLRTLSCIGMPFFLPLRSFGAFTRYFFLSLTTCRHFHALLFYVYRTYTFRRVGTPKDVLRMYAVRFYQALHISGIY